MTAATGPIRRTAWLLALGALLGACQPPPSPPGPAPPLRTTTSLDLPATHAALAERLAAEGFTVERSVGGVTVSSTDPRFTACDRLQLRERGSDDTRSELVRPDRTTATAVIRIEEAGARTRLSWQTRFTGSYLNRFDNLRVEAPCRGTGELERLLETLLPT